MIENCTAVILAGGQSRRMGQDKASLNFEGQSLLARAEQRLKPLFSNIVVSVRSRRDDTLLPQVFDGSDDHAPMLGIAAVLETIHTDWLCVVGVDMPFVVSAVLQQMAAQRAGHDAVLAEVEGHLQPMPAFYAKQACLPAMRSRIAQGRRSLMRLMPSLNTAVMTESDLRAFDPGLRSFVDFDTPEDLHADITQLL